MTRPCIPDPRPAAATERDVRALAAHQLVEATRLGLVDQDVCDHIQAAYLAEPPRWRRVLSSVLSITALIALGFVFACAAWACCLVVFLDRAPGLGLLAAGTGGGALATACFLATMPGVPLDHFGASAWKVRR